MFPLSPARNNVFGHFAVAQSAANGRFLKRSNRSASRPAKRVWRPAGSKRQSPIGQTANPVTGTPETQSAYPSRGVQASQQSIYNRHRREVDVRSERRVKTSRPLGRRRLPRFVYPVTRTSVPAVAACRPPVLCVLP